MSFDATRFRNTLLERLDATGTPLVTIGLPVESSWERAKHAQMNLRNLLDEASETMERYDLTPPNVDAMLEPATSLVEDTEFWGEPSQGLLLLLSPEGTGESLVRRLPFSIEPFGTVDSWYHLCPVWRHLTPDMRFYVLALSSGGVALYRGSRYSMEQVELPDVPDSLEEALKHDEHIPTVSFHSETAQSPGGGDRSAMFFGHEDAGDRSYVKEGIIRFFRTLDNGVRDVLPENTTPPLVLAGADPLPGLYRKVNKYSHLSDEVIDATLTEGGDREWDVNAIHERAWSIVKPRAIEDRQSAIEQFHANPELTAANVGSVLLSAIEGRVDTLFVSDTQAAWGEYDPEQYTVEVHSERQSHDTELMNAAVAHTLRTGGTVYVSDAEDLPEEAPIAALLRY